MNIPRRIVVVVLFLCLSSVRLAAVTATVTNCDEASLRAALASVSGYPGFGGTVNFACDGTIVLTNTITINAMYDVLLDGSGHNVVISGNNAVRVFAVSGFTPGGFTLMNVTVANGVSANGAGLLIGGYSPGTRLVNCTFSNNVAIGNQFAGGGGAIYVSGRSSLVVENSSFLYNRSVGGGLGSAIIATDPESAPYFFLAITNSTFYGNTTAANGGSTIQIGGSLGATNAIVNCTFHNNANGAVRAGGPPYSNVALRNTIASGGFGPNFSGVIDGGYNLSSDGSGNFTAPGSLNNTDPLLGPLANNGGPTLTLALLSGSPAIDGGDSTNCPPTDQRGVARPYGTRCDIGAFESAPPYAIFGSIAGYLSPPGGITVHAGTFTGSVGNDGSYQVHGLPPGPVTVVPTAAKTLFVLSNQVVTLNTDVGGINFRSYQSNAFAIERLTNGTIHSAFAGAVGETWRVFSSTNLFDWTPYSTNTVQPSGLFEVFDNNSPQSQDQFFRGQKP